jgi:hypothetical protein
MLSGLRTVTFLLGCLSTVLAPLSRSAVGFCLFLTYGLAYLTASMYFQYQIEKLSESFKTDRTKYADIDISFVEWLKLKINGIIPVFKGKPEGFTGETVFYYLQKLGEI